MNDSISSFDDDQMDVDDYSVPGKRYKQDDAEERLQELLRGTEIMSKTLATGQMVEPKKKTKAVVGDSRHRKTEKEEDEELLAAEDSNSGTSAYMFTKSPPFIDGEMRDYQIRGLNWLINLNFNNLSGILADEMGLGKTLQTISLLGYMKHVRKINGPFLIILPKSVLQTWENEVNKFCPTLKIVPLIGDESARSRIINGVIMTGNFDIVATTYEMILRTISQLRRITWEYVIIDEAHRIKNEKSKLSEMVRLLRSKNRLLITGTPLQNNLHELWALLNFLLPQTFGNSEEFDSFFSAESCLGDNQAIITRLHDILRPFLLRRIKSDVETSLLPKIELKVYVGLSSMQRELYAQILLKEIDTVNSRGKVEKSRLMNILMHLRKCCNHPYLFQGLEPGPPYYNGEHLFKNCAKMIFLDKLLIKLQNQGSRVLIFSQMSRMLDILQDYCFYRGFICVRLDGQTNYADRQTNIDAFNAPNSPIFIFLATTRAGGVGVNLQTADTVILYDSDWNPQMDLQAQDRAHRLGQKKQVTVYRLITEDSVEERIQEASEIKLRLDSVVIQQGRALQAKGTMNNEVLLGAIRWGSTKICSDKGALTSDEDLDIDTILVRAVERTKQIRQKVETIDESKLLKFSLDGVPTRSLYSFEGQDYSEKNRKGFFLEMPKRERKGKVYSKVDYATKKTNKVEEIPLPKQVQTKNYQFFPLRLIELNEKEMNFFKKSKGIKAEMPKNAKTKKEATAKQKMLQRKIDNSDALTVFEIIERKELTNKGFTSWAKKEYQQFVKSVERYGRSDYSKIALDIQTKTSEEVAEYSDVFFARINEIPEYEKILERVEKVEQALQKKESFKHNLANHIMKYRSPHYQLRINYGGNKSKHWSEDQDRFLLLSYVKHGCDNENVWELVKKDVLAHPGFSQDYFMLTRTTAEVQKRLTTIIHLFEADMENLRGEMSDLKHLTEVLD